MESQFDLAHQRFIESNFLIERKFFGTTKNKKILKIFGAKAKGYEIELAARNARNYKEFKQSTGEDCYEIEYASNTKMITKLSSLPGYNKRAYASNRGRCEEKNIAKFKDMGGTLGESSKGPAFGCKINEKELRLKYGYLKDKGRKAAHENGIKRDNDIMYLPQNVLDFLRCEKVGARVDSHPENLAKMVNKVKKLNFTRKSTQKDRVYSARGNHGQSAREFFSRFMELNEKKYGDYPDTEHSEKYGDMGHIFYKSEHRTNGSTTKAFKFVTNDGNYLEAIGRGSSKN
jgi:hypothetical protein